MICQLIIALRFMMRKCNTSADGGIEVVWARISLWKHMSVETRLVGLGSQRHGRRSHSGRVSFRQ